MTTAIAAASSGKLIVGVFPRGKTSKSGIPEGVYRLACRPAMTKGRASLTSWCRMTIFGVRWDTNYGGQGGAIVEGSVSQPLKGSSVF